MKQHAAVAFSSHLSHCSSSRQRCSCRRLANVYREGKGGAIIGEDQEDVGFIMQCTKGNQWRKVVPTDVIDSRGILSLLFSRLQLVPFMGSRSSSKEVFLMTLLEGSFSDVASSVRSNNKSVFATAC